MQASEAAEALPEKWQHLDINRTELAFQLSPFTDGPSSQCVLTAHPRKVAGHEAVQLWCATSNISSASVAHAVRRVQPWKLRRCRTHNTICYHFRDAAPTCRRPLHEGPGRQSWRLRHVPDVASADGAPLYNIVLRGGDGSDELFLSAACRQQPSLSWFTEMTSTWCRSCPALGSLHHMPSSHCLV